MRGHAEDVRDRVLGVAEGLGVRDAHRLLGREATRAYGVLTREYADAPEPEGRVRLFVYRTRILLLGLSAKLSPPRRLLFALCLVVALIGLHQQQSVIWAVKVALPPWLFLFASVVGLVFLLALELTDRVLVRDELEIARQLQRDLLPRTAVELPGYAVAHSYRTANTIGGDYYDFIPTADGQVALVAGDASGHGIAAGLLMAIASSALKLAMDVDPSPVAVATLVNRALCRSGGRRAFMTMFYGLLDPAKGSLRYACAGHPYPYLRRTDGSVEELGAGCLPLGMRTALSVEERMTVLEPGDTLVLYSDGIPEATDARGNAFGFDRLRAGVVQPADDPQVLHDRILDALEELQGDEPALDDRSLVVVMRNS